MPCRWHCNRQKGIEMKYTQQDLTDMHDKLIAVREAEGEGKHFWELISQYSTIKKALEPHIINAREIIETNIGNYIALKGHGIMDGLKVYCKWDLYKIVGYDSEGNLVLHRYKAKNNVYLPPHAQDQEYRIYTSKEYEQLPAGY